MPRSLAIQRKYGKGSLPLLLVALGLLIGGVATAQESARAEPAPADATLVPAGPDTTLWIDDSGVPRPVLGVTYEEFTRAWQAYQGLQQTSPGPLYTLDEVSVQGTQSDGYAQLSVTLRVTLHTDNPVEVPLGFGQAILMEMPSGLQDNDVFGYSAEGETHSAYLQNGGQRSIGLALRVPITAAGQRKELSVAVPRATLSQFQLHLSGRATEATANDGALLTVDDTLQGTTLSLRGAVGRVRLAWLNPDQAPVSFEPVLTATGELLTELDGGSARTRARLIVQSYGGEFERFRVRLPRGAQLVQPPTGEAPPVSIRSDPAGDSELCLVTLPEKTSGPVSVDITTEQAIGLGAAAGEPQREANPLVDLGGFEVLGAVRQEGDMAVVVDADSKLRWGELQGARRIAVEELPDTLSGPNVSAALRYFRQGFQAPVEVRRQRTRVEATTSYTLSILPDEALLEVATRYQISGPPVLDFIFDLGDWTDTTADQIEPQTLIDLQRVYQSDDGTLETPLKKPQSSAITVKFRARKALSTDGREFSFSLPRPVWPMMDLVGRSELTVTVDPSLRLEVLPETLRNLHAEPPPAEKLPTDDLDGLNTQYFRSDYALMTDDPLRFVGRLTRRAAQRQAEVTTTAEIDQQQIRVQQELSMTIRNEPAESLRLLAPSAVALQGLELYLAPKDSADPLLAASVMLPWRQEEGEDSIVVELPRPWLGPLTLLATFAPQAGWEDRPAGGAIDLEFLCPTGCDSLRHELTAAPPEGVSLVITDEEERWKRVAQHSADSSILCVETTLPTAHLSLGEGAASALPQDNLVVRRVWRQAWVRGGQVQQRVAWRVVTSRDYALIELPPDLTPSRVEARVAGRRVTLSGGDGPNVTAPLPGSDAPEELTVELRYLLPLGDEGLAAMRLRSPRMIGQNALVNSYWQLVLPRDYLVVNKPEGFEAAWDIAWRQGRFRRRQALDVRQLEDWSGAAGQGLSIAVGEHAYLYSSIQAPPGDWSPYTIDRNLTALAASALLLLAGLSIAYAPGVWRTGGVAVAGTALALAAVLYPGELALAAQAGMIGLAALVVGWLTMVLLRQPQPMQVELSGDSTAIRLSTSNSDTLSGLPSERVSTNVSTASVEPTQPVR